MNLVFENDTKNLAHSCDFYFQLFGQLLAGFNGNNSIDIDKLTAMLEENRDLLSDITSKEDCKEGAAQIPKLIFDLVSQADKKSDETENADESSPSAESSAIVDECGDDATASVAASKVTSAQEIIHNLPKVWRVLIELLNHQQLKPVPLKVCKHISSHIVLSSNLISIFFPGCKPTGTVLQIHPNGHRTASGSEC